MSGNCVFSLSLLPLRPLLDLKDHLRLQVGLLLARNTNHSLRRNQRRARRAKDGQSNISQIDAHLRVRQYVLRGKAYTTCYIPSRPRIPTAEDKEAGGGRGRGRARWYCSRTGYGT